MCYIYNIKSIIKTHIFFNSYFNIAELIYQYEKDKTTIKHSWPKCAQQYFLWLESHLCDKKLYIVPQTPLIYEENKTI